MVKKDYTINSDGTVTRIVLPKHLRDRPLLKDLNFSYRQLLSITQIGLMMAAADGTIAEDELRSVSAELLQIGIGESTDVLQRDCFSISGEEALEIIKAMSYKQKQYVTAFLITIMISDRNFHIKEKKYLMNLTNYCQLPIMSVSEANNIMINL